MSPAQPSATGIYRPNVAAIITDDRGNILICERADFAGAWQFPQGGLKAGEDPQAGLARELEEELSLRPADYSVGERRGPYRYLFAEGRTKEGFRGQEQWYFRVRLLALASRINVATAHPEFHAVRWIDPTNFDLSWVSSVKREVYTQVFRDFFAVSLSSPVNATDLESLVADVRALHETLRGMADFRRFPKLLDQTDPEVQGYLDHVVAAVRDARALNGSILEALEGAQVDPGPELGAEPLEEEPLAPLPIEPTPLEQITMANPTGMREVVLVAESSARVLQEVEDALTDYDFRVISVQDGFEAIATYGRLWTAIDLVVLDFDLAGLSGELVFEELLAINPHAAVVVSSGGSAPEKGKFHQMLARGLSGFLPKPFERERLIRQIESILRRRPARS